MLSNLIKTALVLVILATATWFYINRPKTVYFGVAVDGFVTTEKLAEQAVRLDTTPQIIEFYLQWPQANGEHDWNLQLLQSNLKAIDAAGALPCLTWEPFYIDNEVKQNVLISHIKEGRFDSYILAIAKMIGAQKTPVIMRFAHEMNLEEYHWGSPKELTDESPLQYITMYQHVHTIFQDLGIRNALWAYCPNSDSVPNTGWNTIQAYYPGDAFVDLLGLDGYNWFQVRPDTETRSFAQIFEQPLSELRNLNKKLPVIIFETATAGTSEEKQMWLQKTFEYAVQHDIIAVIWFDVKKEADWTLEDVSGTSLLIRQSPTAIEWAQDLLDQRDK